MASGSEALDIVIRARGGRQAAAETRMVEQSFAGLGKTIGSMRVMVDAGTESSRRASSAFMEAAGASARLAAGYAVLRGASATLHSGIDFVSTIEQNQIAFEQFTGSAKMAAREIDALRVLANDLPSFGFDTFAADAKKLAAMGTPLNRINRDLKIMAETATGLGLGSEGLDRITLAIGQMRSTGVVQGDELRQLQEAGIKVYDYLIKAGVITREDIGQIGQMHIASARAIDAIMNGMAADFGGLSKRARNTWAFQIGALKNNAAAAAGALVQPIVKFAESNVLPKLTTFFKNSATYLQAGGANQILETLGKIMPLILLATDAWLSYRAALILVAAAQKAATVWSFLIALYAVIPAIYTAATGTGTLAAAWTAFDVAVDANGIVIAITAIIVAISALVTLFAKSEGARNAFAAFFRTLGHILADVWGMLVKIRDFLQHPLGGGKAGNLPFTRFDIPGIPFMASGGTIPVGGAAIVGEAGAELARNRGGRTEITPLTGGAAPTTRTLQPIQLTVDGRVLAEAIMDVGMTAAARA